MSVDAMTTLANLKKIFKKLHVVIPVVVMGILLVIGRQPMPTNYMDFLISVSVSLYTMILIVSIDNRQTMFYAIISRKVKLRNDL